MLIEGKRFRFGVVALTLAGVGVIAAQPTALHAAETPRAALVSLTPCRLLDTRLATQMEGGSTTSVATAGRCAIPGGATALAITLTVTQTVGPGFLTAWPAQAVQPVASNLNYGPGATQANGAIVQTGTQGMIQLYSSATTHVIVDVTGAFVAQPTSTATAGRFVGLPGQRVFDTRTGTRPAPGTTVTIPLPQGVPSDALALAVNITTTASSGGGYFTAFGAGTARPTSSSLNTDGVSQTRAATQIVPVSPAGLSIYTQRGDHIIVDVSGYFTGASAPRSGDGLFVAQAPLRLLDTRSGRTPLPRAGIRRLQLSGLSSGVAAIVANFTVTQPTREGYLTVFPALTTKPAVSSLNGGTSTQTTANMGIIPISSAGLDVFSAEGAHFIVDIAGWFTGTPTATTVPTPHRADLPADAAKVLLMGDSTMAGIRWYGNSVEALGGADFTVDVESCRRLIGESCAGREGRRPPNAVDAIAAQTGPFDVVVVMTGYNDWYTTMATSFDQVVAASRAKGAKRIIWMTYREGTSYHQPTSGRLTNESYQLANQTLRQKVASGEFPDVVLADWSEYSSQSPEWFTADGVHFTIAGAYGAADYISRVVAFEAGKACPAPWLAGGLIESPCSNPDDHPAVGAMTLYKANPNDVHCYEVGDDRHVECRQDPKLATTPAA